jgi:hypothetical protein
MILLSIFETTLPLTNPVLKFLLILVIILFAPIILNKIKIPHLLGQSRNFHQDDNLIIILSKKYKPSFHSKMSKIPSYLNKYFVNTSYILIFPMQTGVTDTSQDEPTQLFEC